MKFFKKDYELNKDNLTDAERVDYLEKRVNHLGHYLKIMARGYVILFIAVLLTFVANEHTLNKVDTEESNTKSTQLAGAPTGVCLREGIKSGLPILVNFADVLEKAESKTPDNEKPIVQLFINLTRNAEKPLQSYVELQEKRYPGVVCPKPHE